MIQDQRAIRYLQPEKTIRRERRFSVSEYLDGSTSLLHDNVRVKIRLRVNDHARITINLWANGYIALFAALHRTIYYDKEKLARTCAIYYCFGYDA